MKTPIIVWFRRDLRLSDHPALHAACRVKRPIIPVLIIDDDVEKLGAAPKWRFGLGVSHFKARLGACGSDLVVRRGTARDVLNSIISEVGASDVFWTRVYDPQGIARDVTIKRELRAKGINACSFCGSLLFEPWKIATETGGFYRVYTPFWKKVSRLSVAEPLPDLQGFRSPEMWPRSDAFVCTEFEKAMGRGATVVRPYVQLGEEAAQIRLQRFVDKLVYNYHDNRDRPDLDSTSHLSEHLSLGEISPQMCWHAGLRAMQDNPQGAEKFLKELVWREFAYHLMYHTPHILDANWRTAWDDFPWNLDKNEEVTAWMQGRTGIPFVDSAMREMYVTGRMHNRGRMIVASYLTKHLMTHWTIGQQWFADCLIDWDLASNAMGWQWTAGSGPDASPYFRIFNPATQRDKFDPNGTYVNRWIAELALEPGEDALSYFDAIPPSWNLSPDDDYPAPIVSIEDGRKRAMQAYESRRQRNDMFHS
ncbi:MAG: deoxyribodipyrimidine photo-lyase [Aestuariivita sp.]|nr:deoxyribodipyrimidine photo-lyase [Aestuariivita sp.]